MIGWSTYPPPRAYPHHCRRYELHDDDEEWEEYYEPVPKAQATMAAGRPGQLKPVAKITKNAQNIVKQVIKRRLDQRRNRAPLKSPPTVVKPTPKPALKLKQRREGFDPLDGRQQKKTRFVDDHIQLIQVKTV